MRGVCGIASELIDYDSKYDKVFKSLLGSTIIIDNMDNAVEFSRATGYSTKIVTLDESAQITVFQRAKIPAEVKDGSIVVVKSAAL